MNQESVRKFSQKAAAQRQALYGETILLEATPVSASCTAIQRSEQLVHGGTFELVRSFIARIPYTALGTRPAEESRVTRDGEPFKIDRVSDSKLGQEWVITCRSAV